MNSLKEIMEMKDTASLLTATILLNMLSTGPQAWQEADTMIVEMKCPELVREALKNVNEMLTTPLSGLESETFNLIFMMGMVSLSNLLDFNEDREKIINKLNVALKEFQTASPQS